MYGVAAPSFSAGSSQRAARVTWTAHVTWPSGPVACARARGATTAPDASRTNAASAPVNHFMGRLLARQSPGSARRPYRSAELLDLGQDLVRIGELPLAVALGEAHHALVVDDEGGPDVGVPVRPVHAVIPDHGALDIGQQRIA